MKRLLGLGVVIVVALAISRLPSTLDIGIHDRYWVVPLKAIGFWFLLGVVVLWFLNILRAYPHRHS